MYTINDIINFLEPKIGAKNIHPDDDIYLKYGVWGDDVDELMAEYAKEFGVNMESYLWYFHTGEEGMNMGTIFFEAPYDRVKTIAITPELLLRSANTGKWSVDYPEHTLPKRRWDITFDWVIILTFILLVIFLTTACNI